MRTWRFFVGGAAAGVLYVALREAGRRGWPRWPGRRERAEAEMDILQSLGQADPDREPLLGYDGMDEETLLEWLNDSELDEESLVKARIYEERHLAREPVLDALDERL